MVKRRPVVVISPADTHARHLCTVVPLSTTEPTIEREWHVLLEGNPLPETWSFTQVWAKCDMLYTVAFQRLDKPHQKDRAGRQYFSPRTTEKDLSRILDGVELSEAPCVGHGEGRNRLALKTMWKARAAPDVPAETRSPAKTSETFGAQPSTGSVSIATRYPGGQARRRSPLVTAEQD